MSYRNGYRQRSGSRPMGGQGSRWMQVRYPGTCKVCGGAVAAGETAYWDAAARTLTCYRIDCAGADGLTERAGRWAGNPDGVLSRRAYRVGTPAPQRAGGSAGVIATTFSSGATVYRNARGRCEDAPCCGCCD